MNLLLEEYLKPTAAVDSGTKSIKEKAQELTIGQVKITDKAKSLFYFVRDDVKFSSSSPRYLFEHFLASNTLNKGEGDCVQTAILLAALARASGIPARLGYVDVINYFPVGRKMAKIMGTNVVIYNGYSELYIEGKWIKANPSLDPATCLEHRIIPVEFDGTRDAMLHSHNQDGELHIEYIRYHGPYLDIPFDEIKEAIKQTYESGMYERIKSSGYYDEIMEFVEQTYGPEAVEIIVKSDY